MKRPVLKLVLSLCLLAVVLYATVGYSPVESLVSNQTDVLVRVPRPVEFVSKIADAELTRRFGRMPAMEDLGKFLGLWDRIKDNAAALATLRFFVKDVYVAVPENTGSAALASYYLDAGFVGRVLSDLAQYRLLNLSGRSLYHGGFRMFPLGPAAVAFVDNFIIFGAPPNLFAAIDASTGGLSALPDNGEQLRRAGALVDDAADATAIILDHSMFRPSPQVGRGLDPRGFFRASAIDAATANLTLTDDGVKLRLAIQPVAGKLVSPLTVSTPGPFTTRTAPDDGTLLYAALRLERPTELSAVLLEMLGSDEMKSLKKKLTLLMLNTFFEYTSHEFAILLDEDLRGEFPVLVFELAKPDAMLELLAKLSKTAESQTSLLSMPYGPNGETLAALLADAAGGESAAWLDKIPASQRPQIETLAKKIRAGLLDPKKILEDSQRIYMFGRSWHWRLGGNRLILATLPEHAERYLQNLTSGPAPKEMQDGAGAAPLDGPVLAWVNLASVLGKMFPDPEHPLNSLAAAHPRLAIGATTADGRFELRGAVPIALGLGKPPGFSTWYVALHVMQYAGYLLALFCLYVAVRAVLTLATRRRAG